MNIYEGGRHHHSKGTPNVETASVKIVHPEANQCSATKM